MSADQPPSQSQSPSPFTDLAESELAERLEASDYVAEPDVVTTVFIALRLGRPLLVEGAPGSGKTELGKALASGFDTELIRLQCYEGLTAENALYEWNYTKQLLAVQGNEGTVTGTGTGTGPTEDGQSDPSRSSDTSRPANSGPAATSDARSTRSGTSTAADGPRSVFDEAFLLERPLLRALRFEGPTPPVLLIDEIDRADAAFEAFLLEVLSDFQVSIPELGTVRARQPPVVVLTSNRSRGLSDALKRRCLYLHLEPPSFEKEYEIVRRKVPALDATVAAEVCAVVADLREETFLKQPGVAETLDWARAVATLRTEDGNGSLSPSEIERTVGCLLKEVEDIQRVDDALLERLHAAAVAAADRIE